MIRAALLTAAVLLVSVPASAGKPKYVYGPAPSWDAYRALGEKAVLAELPDAEGWHVEWPNGYVPAGWGPRSKVPGYMTCGVLRTSGAPIDGRYFINFAIVIDHGAVKQVDVARKSNSAPNLICPALLKRGMLPPAAAMQQQTNFSVEALGLAATAMAEGAYVVSVGDGSPAAEAGLTPGMLIARVNGVVALSALGPAMQAVLAANTPTLTLEIASGDTLRIERRR